MKITPRLRFNIFTNSSMAHAYKSTIRELVVRQPYSLSSEKQKHVKTCGSIYQIDIVEPYLTYPGFSCITSLY